MESDFEAGNVCLARKVTTAGADGGGNGFSLGFGLRIVEPGRLEPGRRGKRIERGRACRAAIVTAAAARKVVMAAAGAASPSRCSRNAAHAGPLRPRSKRARRVRGAQASAP